MTVLYIHGKGGSADEAAHYSPLFPGCEVRGLDYHGAAPWAAGDEIRRAVREEAAASGRVFLIANSIGAFFSMCAGIENDVARAWFISPIVDLEKLILDMMGRAGVTEAALRDKGTIRTAYGEELSWEYLRWVRAHPVRWNVPTELLYGSRDDLTSVDTIRAFMKARPARLTVMDGGEHWFHTPEQMAFLDGWLRASQRKDA